MTVEKYRTIVRIIATILIVYQGLYYATTQPGKMDTLNGIMGGLAIYCIWIAKNKSDE